MIRRWFPPRGSNINGKKPNMRFFTFDALRIATNNFSTLLGRGGFGKVYKGVLPDDNYNGRKRAVVIKIFKRHYNGFLEMVELMSSLRHINLIQVIGCCVDDGQQLLVCEFAENRSVLYHLHGEEAPSLDWERRALICLGTARGLSYLHQEISPGIIHRDIKPSNIVLDSNFVPKIVDFDLIRVVEKNVSDTKRNVDAHPVGIEDWTTYDTTDCRRGTLAYMDPNYIIKGELTEKADVYSFGILMLEIITGRRPLDYSQHNEDDRVLLDWVTRVSKDGMVLNIVDQKLTDFPKEDAERFINVALACTQSTPKQRPSMFEVVYMLYGRHKSDQEISEMATRAIAERLAQRNSTHVIDVLYGSHQQTSEMATWEISNQTGEWSTTYNVHSPVLVESIEGTSKGVVYAAEMESRGDLVDETESGDHHDSIIVSKWTGVSESKGECSSSNAALASLGTESASSSKQDEICPEDLVRACFERSMDKIMRYHVAMRGNTSDGTTIMSQTIVIKKPPGNTFMEAVYPPFLTGVYRRPSLL